MKHYEIRELVNDLVVVAITFHDSQQLRERIKDVLLPRIREDEMKLEQLDDIRNALRLLNELSSS